MLAYDTILFSKRQRYYRYALQQHTHTNTNREIIETGKHARPINLITSKQSSMRSVPYRSRNSLFVQIVANRMTNAVCLLGVLQAKMFRLDRQRQ